MGFPAPNNPEWRVQWEGMFQSLIGIYGFSGADLKRVKKFNALFQSLIGIYGFSGRISLWLSNLQDIGFQSLIGIYGFSGVGMYLQSRC